MLVAVKATFVPFGLPKPACQIEVILWHVRVVTPDKQARLKTGHDTAHVLPGRISALFALLLQDLKLGLTLGTRTAVGLECRLDRSHLLHVTTQVLLRGVHSRQPPVDRAGQTREALVRRSPFFASRFRWSDARTAPKASAMRKPGGWSGPP